MLSYATSFDYEASLHSIPRWRKKMAVKHRFEVFFGLCHQLTKAPTIFSRAGSRKTAAFLRCWLPR
jgi:hypothetical protein